MYTSSNRKNVAAYSPKSTWKSRRRIPIPKNRVSPIVQLQQKLGNQTLQQLHKAKKSSPVPVMSANNTPLLGQTSNHPKLKIGSSNDQYEKEADHIAGQIMKTSGPESDDHGENPLGLQKKFVAQRLVDPLESKHRRGVQKIRRKVTNSREGGSKPRVLQSVLHSSGKPLERSTRMFFESQFGRDFSSIRIHTGPKAAASAKSLNADAYTLGNEIVFNSEQYSPATTTGRRLLAHELTHSLQQGPRQFGVNSPIPGNRQILQRRVSRNYSGIEERLTYGFTDWAITDREAREVLQILGGLSERDLADTVVAMDREGYVERLLDNISSEDEEQNAVLISRIHRFRSTRRTTERIVDRLSYGFFDWAITDRDAHEVLQALMGLGFQQLRLVVAKMINEGVFDRFMDNLREGDRRRFQAFVERILEIRREFRSLVSQHLAFFRRPPDPARPQDTGRAGARISGIVGSTGYGGQTPTFGTLPEAEQEVWRTRAENVFRELRASVRGTELEDILARSRIVFDPDGTERSGFGPGREVYAFVRGSDVLHVGRSWVRNAEDNIRNVWQSIAHELGGHDEYGDTWAYEILRATVRSLTPEERSEATNTIRSLYSAFGYLETEMYSELRELPYREPGSGGDSPTRDVPKLLKRILKAFGLEVGRQIILRFYYRVAQDPRITPSARQFLFQAIQRVTGGIFPLASPLGP